MVTFEVTLNSRTLGLQTYSIQVDDKDAMSVLANGPWKILRQQPRERSGRMRSRRTEKLYVYRKVDGVRQPQYLHHFLIERASLSGKLECDHIDGNPLNNRRTNLRVVTRSENALNRKKKKS